MKIAHLLPYTAKFPLKKHNGRYDWALTLARMQVASGHDVTLFAAPDSSDDSAITWQSIDTHEDKLSNNIALIRTAFADTSFDIYHSHFDYLPHTLADLTDKPLITTQHWFPIDKIARGLRENMRPNATVVPVTKLMKTVDQHLGIPCSEVIYHGIDLSLFSFQAEASERFLFVGRITPSKGVKEAVQYALAAGVSLDIVGKVNEADHAYWQEILPMVDGEQISYLGPLPHSEVAVRMQHARAMIFPSQTPEAFGLVTIEAQACGTPVVISDIGASKELVIHEQTGFVVSSEQDFTRALGQADSIDRYECRKNAERFDIYTMHSQYLELYKHLSTL